MKENGPADEMGRCTSSTISTGYVQSHCCTVDRDPSLRVSWQSNLGNAKTDGLDRNLHFVGNDYSLLILLFYVPFGLCDLPWNLLTKRYSARVTLSISMSASSFPGWHPSC